MPSIPIARSLLAPAPGAPLAQPLQRAGEKNHISLATRVHYGAVLHRYTAGMACATSYSSGFEKGHPRMEQQPDSSHTLDQLLRRVAEQAQREQERTDNALGLTSGAGFVALTQDVALSSGAGVYQSQCPDCGSLNLSSAQVRVDPKTRAPLGKRSILRILATALLYFIIGMTVLIVMSVSTLDEGMGLEGIWIIALPVFFVNLVAFGFLIAGVLFAANGLTAALRKPNGYLRT